MTAAGYEASHLLHYEAPTLTLAGSGIDEAGAGYSVSAGQGSGVPLTVAASGGTLGGREARLVEVEADGTEAVLRDWGAMSNSSDTRSSSLAYTWTPLRDRGQPARRGPRRHQARPLGDPHPDPRCSLEKYIVIVENLADSCHILSVSIIGTGFSAGSGKLVQHNTSSKICRILFQKLHITLFLPFVLYPRD